MRFNHIDEETLQKGLEYLEIKKVNQGEYFLHEGEPSKFFCGLIKGKISFRKSKIINRQTNEIVLKHLYRIAIQRKPTLRRQMTKRNFSKYFTYRNNVNNNEEKNQQTENNKSKEKTENSFEKIQKIRNNLDLSKDVKFLIDQRNSVSQNNTSIKSNLLLFQDKNDKSKEYRVIREYFDPKKYLVTEEELFRAGVGYCFGEWALIYNQPRAASVYALEDCVFFTLDEKYFKKSFLKSLINSESKKKKFVLDNLFPFDILNERQSSLYKNIVPITIERNQIIFKEGEISDTIYLIYFGTFNLEKKYKDKNFNVLSLERGSIVGLESIFEGKYSKYKCTLKLTSYDEYGLIFSCNVNTLVPYIINKMKERFKNNYLLFLKSSEEFYLNNINISKKKFFKKKEDDEEYVKDKFNLRSKGFLSLKNLNKNENKLSLINFKKIKNKNIKVTNTTQIKVNSLPILLKKKINDIKNKKDEINKRKDRRAISLIKNKENEKLNLSIEEYNENNLDKKNIRKQRKKRMKTLFGYSFQNKIKMDLINDNNNISIELNKNIDDNKSGNEIEEHKNNLMECTSDKINKKYLNYLIFNKKDIEEYKNTKRYIMIQKNKINELLNINNVNSLTEKNEKYINATSQCEISNINNKTSRGNLSTKKSSVKTLSNKVITDSKNCETSINFFKDDYSKLRHKLIKHKKKIGFNLFNKKNNKSDKKYDSRLIMTKREDKSKLSMSSIKFNKNKNSIEKYVNYLLSNRKEPSLEEDLCHTHLSHLEEKKDKNNFNKNHIKTRNLFINEGFFNRYKSINDTELFYKNDIISFNSGSYNLPLMTCIIRKNEIDKID